MPIALDLATTSTTTPFSHTCSGTDRILFVAISNGSSLQDTTGVTYGGAAMTQIQTRVDSGSSSTKLWYLINPATGANSVAITGGTTAMRASAVSFTGVNQTTPIGASVTATAAMTSTVPLTATVTTTGANSWLFGAFSVEGSSAVGEYAFSVGTEHTEGTAGTGVGASASNTTTTTGSYSITWTRSQTTARNGGTIVAEFMEAGGAPAVTYYSKVGMMGMG